MRLWTGRRRILRRATAVASAAAGAATVHAAVNSRLLRPFPPAPRDGVAERVSVLIPARDEQPRIGGAVRSVLASRGVTDLEVLVYDDHSTDATAATARAVAAGDPRLQVLTGPAPPPGQLGKPHACARLARVATGDVLLFCDADVRVHPDAVARGVALLRTAGLDALSAYPRLDARGLAERLVQPLLPWLWLSFLPVRLAERSTRAALTAAGGQLLLVDAAAYQACGGHAGVATEVLEDLALARALKRAGARVAITDAAGLATCRMYADWRSLREGYEKSLWAAYGGPARGLAVAALLGGVYLLPALAALAGDPLGWVGYAAGVTGRVLSARRTGGRVFPDALAHPVSIALAGGLTGSSVLRHHRGQLTWKGRTLPGRPGAR